MSGMVIRRCIALTLLLVALGASAAIASGASGSPYCDPLHTCPNHRLKVTPGTIKAGHRVRLHGSVSHGCQTPGQVTIYSRAFKGAVRHSFAGIPALFTRANKHGSFSATVRIRKTIKPGKYHIGGRCGGGNFGSTTLKVLKAS
jgi:hypothetical protein